MPSTLPSYRTDFPLLNHRPVAWLDNASTTHKPSVVLAAEQTFYQEHYANVHRGLYDLSSEATAAYEAVRETVRQFIGAASTEEIIFTSGTTAGLNLLAQALGRMVLRPGDVILLSPLEHHSNLVPWQMIARQLHAKLEFFDLTTDTRLDHTTFHSKIHDRVKIIALTHISNAAGTVNDIATITQLAHSKGIPVVVDAAQSVPHRPINVTQLDCDFLVWSGHKMCGPTGTGVVYGKKRWLEALEPVYGGGDMIKTVTLTNATWNDLPYKFEPGTPNIAGVVGLGAAVHYLQQIGLKRIEELTTTVYHYLLDQLATLDFVKVLGPQARSDRSSIASFIVQKAHPHDVAQVLNQHQVAVRAGHHCTQPLMKHWGVPATTRASVYFYTTTAEVDQLIVGLKKVYDLFK